MSSRQWRMPRDPVRRGGSDSDGCLLTIITWICAGAGIAWLVVLLCS